MITYRSIRALLILAACNLAVIPAAAQKAEGWDAFKDSGELRKRTAKTAGDIEEYVNQLDKSDRALYQVGKAKSNDLRKRYESFSKTLDKLAEVQARATSDIERMKLADTEYFSSWAKANGQIADTELRYASAERRSRAIEKHRELADSLSDIGLQLQPFMSNLRDLKAFLGADLSPNNVDKASEMIRASRSDAQALKYRIASVQDELRRFLQGTPK